MSRYTSEHDLPWFSDPDYDRSGQLIEPERDDPRDEYNPELERKEEENGNGCMR